MAAGRKPVPTAIKALRGTARADRVLRNEAQFPVPGRMLRVPSGLTDDGEVLWYELGRLLLDAGLFTYGDRIALEMLCMAYGRMKHAQSEVQNTGGEILKSSNGNLYQNPWTSVLNKTWDQVKGMLAEFGLTPAERTRVSALVESKQDDSLANALFNAIEAFQGQGPDSHESGTALGATKALQLEDE